MISVLRKMIFWGEPALFSFPNPPPRQNGFPFGEDTVLLRAHVFHHVENVAVERGERTLQGFHLFAVDHRLDDVHLVHGTLPARHGGAKIYLVERLHQFQPVFLGVDAAEHDAVGDSVFEQDADVVARGITARVGEVGHEVVGAGEDL